MSWGSWCCSVPRESWALCLQPGNPVLTSVGQAANLEDGRYLFLIDGNKFFTQVVDGRVLVIEDADELSTALPHTDDLALGVDNILNAVATNALAGTATTVHMWDSQASDFDVSSTHATHLQRVANFQMLGQGAVDNVINDSWTGTGAGFVTVNASCTTTLSTVLSDSVFHVCGIVDSFNWLPAGNISDLPRNSPNRKLRLALSAPAENAIHDSFVYNAETGEYHSIYDESIVVTRDDLFSMGAVPCIPPSEVACGQCFSRCAGEINNATGDIKSWQGFAGPSFADTQTIANIFSENSLDPSGYYFPWAANLTEIEDLPPIIHNPADTARGFSSIWANDPPGTGNARSQLDSPQAWSSLSNNLNQWLEIPVSSGQQVVGIRTQGRADSPQWVSGYRVSARLADGSYVYVDGGSALTGNSDRNTYRDNSLTVPDGATAIRVEPTSWSGHISMRAALRVAAEHSLIENTTPGRWHYNYDDSRNYERIVHEGYVVFPVLDSSGVPLTATPRIRFIKPSSNWEMSNALISSSGDPADAQWASTTDPARHVTGAWPATGVQIPNGVAWVRVYAGDDRAFGDSGMQWSLDDGATWQYIDLNYVSRESVAATECVYTYWNCSGGMCYGDNGQAVSQQDVESSGFVNNATCADIPACHGLGVEYTWVNTSDCVTDGTTGIVVHGTTPPAANMFLLLSNQPIRDRWPALTFHAQHANNFVAVGWDGSQWLIDMDQQFSGIAPVPFTPEADDILVGSLDYGADTYTPSSAGVYNGIVTYDLGVQVAANQFNGGASSGEFDIVDFGFSQCACQVFVVDAVYFKGEDRTADAGLTLNGAPLSSLNQPRVGDVEVNVTVDGCTRDLTFENTVPEWSAVETFDPGTVSGTSSFAGSLGTWVVTGTVDGLLDQSGRVAMGGNCQATSPIINISSCASNTLKIDYDMTEAGTLEPGDFYSLYYRLDGGAWNLVFQKNDDGARIGQSSFSRNGARTIELQVRCGLNTSGGQSGGYAEYVVMRELSITEQ